MHVENIYSLLMSVNVARKLIVSWSRLIKGGLIHN